MRALASSSLLVALAALGPRPAAGAAESSPVVAAFPIEADAKAVPKRLQRTLLSALEVDLVSSGRFSIVPRADLESALRASKAQSFSDCYDEACQIELGKEVAAEKIVQSAIAKLGDSCEVTLKLFDLARATASRASTATDACSAVGLRRAVRAAAYRLAGVAPPKRNLSIRFETVDLPVLEQPAFSAAQSNLQVSLDAVDADALVAYDAAVKAERDPKASTADKIAAWKKVKRHRAKDLRRRAKDRIAAWNRYAKAERRAQAARRRFEKKRDTHWKKLSKLLKLEVVSEADKQDWAVAFVEAYGGQGQNPYFDDPVFNRYVGLAAWKSASKALGETVGERQASLSRFLATYPECPPALKAQSELDGRVAAHVKAIEAPVSAFPMPFGYSIGGRAYDFHRLTRFEVVLDRCQLRADYDYMKHYNLRVEDNRGAPKRPTAVSVGRYVVDLTQVKSWSTRRDGEPLQQSFFLVPAAAGAPAQVTRRGTVTSWGDRIRALDGPTKELRALSATGLRERVAALNALAALCYRGK